MVKYQDVYRMSNIKQVSCEIQTSRFEGQRYGTVSKVLALQMQGASPDSPSEKPGTTAGTCNPSTGEVDTGGSMGFTGQSV